MVLDEEPACGNAIFRPCMGQRTCRKGNSCQRCRSRPYRHGDFLKGIGSDTKCNLIGLIQVDRLGRPEELDSVRAQTGRPLVNLELMMWILFIGHPSAACWRRGCRQGTSLTG